MPCTTVDVPDEPDDGDEPEPTQGCINFERCRFTIQDDGSIVYGVEGILENAQFGTQAQPTVQWFLDGREVATYAPWRVGTQPAQASSDNPPGSVRVGSLSQARQEFGAGPVDYEVEITTFDFPMCGDSRQSCGTVTIPSAFDPAGVTVDGCQTPNSLTAGETGEVTVEVRNVNDDAARVSLSISGGGTVWGTADVNVPTGTAVFNVPVNPPPEAAGQSITPTITINSAERATNTTSSLLRGGIL